MRVLVTLLDSVSQNNEFHFWTTNLHAFNLNPDWPSGAERLVPEYHHWVFVSTDGSAERSQRYETSQ
jgi:hypothetical protein